MHWCFLEASIDSILVQVAFCVTILHLEVELSLWPLGQARLSCITVQNAPCQFFQLSSLSVLILALAEDHLGFAWCLVHWLSYSGHRVSSGQHLAFSLVLDIARLEPFSLGSRSPYVVHLSLLWRKSCHARFTLVSSCNSRFSCWWILSTCGCGQALDLRFSTESQRQLGSICCLIRHIGRWLYSILVASFLRVSWMEIVCWSPTLL